MRPVARIAQSVEQGIENPRVLGSIPSPGTIIQKRLLIFQDEKMTGTKWVRTRNNRRCGWKVSPSDTITRLL